MVRSPWLRKLAAVRLGVCLFVLALLAGVDRAAAQGFVAASTNSVGLTPYAVVAADVLGDGRSDLVTANYAGSTVSVLINVSSAGGGFVLSSSPGANNGPQAIAAADVNGDGKVDLICANTSDGTLTVLTNNGIGGFLIATNPSVGVNNPISVAAADVNGDGKVDLISANYNPAGTLTVMTNAGNNVFVISQTLSVGSDPTCVIAADVNGDGKPDLICANYGGGAGNTLTVLTNNGAGRFVLASTPTVGTAPFCVAAADVNGDGKVDLISANYVASGTLTVLTNSGSGGKFVLASSPGVGNSPVCVVAADVNGDGKPDLICANRGGNTLTVLTNKSAGIFVLAATPGVGNQPISVVAADVNGDGKPDLICANYIDNTVTVLTNNFTFTPPNLSIAAAGNQVVVYYPLSNLHFTLQTITNLASTNWVTASNGVPVTAYTFTNTAPASFYRLH